jgi:hypothetical protein
MRNSSLLIGLALVFAFAAAPNPAMAQEAPKVINVAIYDVAEDMPKFLEFFKRAIAITKQYESSGQSRVWLSTFAGPDTNMVAVATEFPTFVSMAESNAKVMASPEWQKLVAEFEAAGMQVLSNGVSIEVTP